VALNPNLPDADVDGISNACDLCPGTRSGAVVDDFGCGQSQVDPDGDRVCAGRGARLSSRWCAAGVGDNCPSVANVGQTDSDNNGVGDACDGDSVLPCGDDADGDTLSDLCDNCT
jgi:hypothetical protein